MTITCKNCKTSFKGNFCHNCGQPAKTHRLDFHSVWHDIQHGLLHVDKGIVYSIMQLFTRPGYTISEYLAGKRVKHFKPVSMLIVLATVYVLVNHFLHMDLIEESGNKISIKNLGIDVEFDITQGTDKPLAATIRDFVESKFALLQLLFLPAFAFASWLAFRKSGYNYIEHLVINAFLRGQAMVIAIFLLPFVYFGAISREVSSTLLSLLQVACLFWAFFQLFYGYKKLLIVKKTILSMMYLLSEVIVVTLITILVLYVLDSF